MINSAGDIVFIIVCILFLAVLGALTVLIKLLLRSNDRIKELKIETAALRAEIEHIAQKVNSKE